MSKAVLASFKDDNVWVGRRICAPVAVEISSEIMVSGREIRVGDKDAIYEPLHTDVVFWDTILWCLNKKLYDVIIEREMNGHKV